MRGLSTRLGVTERVSPSTDQYLDIRLNYPFLCLSVDSVLQVMAALLTEQRIVFLSALYPMLTYCIQVTGMCLIM